MDVDNKLEKLYNITKEISPMQPSAPQPLRQFPFFSTWDDLPAFESGAFVVAAIIASLLNFGVLIFLIVARVTLDFVRLERFAGLPRSRTELALRESLLEIVLLLLGLDVALYTGGAPSVVTGTTTDLAIWTVLVGMALLIPKLTILWRFARRLLYPLDEAAVRARGKMSLSSEVLSFLLILGSLLLLSVAPRILPGGMDTVMHVLRRQLIPWRL